MKPTPKPETKTERYLITVVSPRARWHLPIATVSWNSQRGLWRDNYDTRVCECLWLTDYGVPSVDNPPCKPAINLTVAKASTHGTLKSFRRRLVYSISDSLYRIYTVASE
jgi:hypothetical protein